MRTIRTKVYKFNELSKDAQQTAIEKNWDINVDYDWWEQVYEDAANIGLTITAFDIDRGSYCKGDFTESLTDVAKKIIDNHGKECETYKDAAKFLSDYELLEDDDTFEDEYEELAAEFEKTILEDYRIMLDNSYTYFTSEESIKEMIIANEMEFTKDGKSF